MKKNELILPVEESSHMYFRRDDLPGVMVVASSLKKFEQKEVFGCHCSVLFEVQDSTQSGTSYREQEESISGYADYLKKNISGPDNERPNALFLARVTWNNKREVIWRVSDSAPVIAFLNEEINNGKAWEPFKFTMELDPEWELANWYLENC